MKKITVVIILALFLLAQLMNVPVHADSSANISDTISSLDAEGIYTIDPMTDEEIQAAKNVIPDYSNEYYFAVMNPKVLSNAEADEFVEDLLERKVNPIKGTYTIDDVRKYLYIKYNGEEKYQIAIRHLEDPLRGYKGNEGAETLPASDQANSAMKDENIEEVTGEFEIVVNTDRSAFDMAKPDQVSDKLPKKIDAKLTSLSFISEDEKISKDLIELLILAYEKPETFAASDIKVGDVGVYVIGELRDKVISNTPFLNSIKDKNKVEFFISKYGVWLMYSDNDYNYIYDYSPKGSIIKTVSYKDYKNTYAVANRNNITLQKLNSAKHIVRSVNLQTRMIIYYIVLPLSLWLIIGAFIIYAKKTL